MKQLEIKRLYTIPYSPLLSSGTKNVDIGSYTKKFYNVVVS